MNQKSCKKCGSISLYTKSKGNQTGLYCSDCGAWIKWLNKDEIRAFEHERLKTSETSHHGEWIPCSERLPESEEPEVLCLVISDSFFFSFQHLQSLVNEPPFHITIISNIQLTFITTKTVTTFSATYIV